MLLTQVVSATLDYTVAPNKWTVVLDQPVGPQLVHTDKFTLDNITTGDQILDLDVEPGPNDSTVIVTAPQQVRYTAKASTLADGYYRLALSKLDLTSLASDWHADDLVLGGDANLDGRLTFDDHVAIDIGFNQHYTGWTNGDFDYDGSVTLGDYAVLDTGLNASPIQHPPAEPGVITASWVPDQYAIAVNWNPATVDPNAGVRVQRSLDGHDFSQWYVNLPAGSPEAQSGAWLDDSLGEGVRAYYRIRAYGDGLDTAYTPKQYAVTAIAPPTMNHFEQNADGSIGAGWSSAISDAATELRVYISKDNANYGLAATLDPGATSWTLTDPAPNSRYEINITAANSVGESSLSGTWYVVTKPAAPTNVTIWTYRDSSTGATVRWSGGVGLAKTVEYRAIGEQTWKTKAVAAADSLAHLGSPDLTPGQRFEARVTTTNASGSSEPSGIATGWTAPNPPINGDAITDPDRTFRFQWTDLNQFESGYEGRMEGEYASYPLVRTGPNASGAQPESWPPSTASWVWTEPFETPSQFYCELRTLHPATNKVVWPIDPVAPWPDPNAFAPINPALNFTPIVRVSAEVVSDVNRGTIAEGSAGSLGTGVFWFARQAHSLAAPLTVNFTVEGTADEGDDYVSLGRSVTFAPGQFEVAMPITALTDEIAEPDETLTVRITSTSSSAVVAMDGTATLVVKDRNARLDVDSNNDSGYDPDPHVPGDAEDAIEDDSSKPGKIIAVADGDSDADGVPDYADGMTGAGTGTTSPGGASGKWSIGSQKFVPVVLTVPDGVNLSTAKFKLTYDANDPLNGGIVAPSGGSTEWSLGPGSLRLWKNQNVARVRDARDPANTTPGSNGEFIKSDTAYSASQLGIDTTLRTVTLWLEAVKASAQLGNYTSELAVAPTTGAPSQPADAVRLTALKADLGFNTGDVAKPGVVTPDVNWTIDAADERVEEKGDGFRFWWSRDHDIQDPSTVTKDGLTDLVPFRVDLSAVPRAFFGQQMLFRFKLTNVQGTWHDLYLYDAASPATDRRRFVADNATAAEQLAKTPFELNLATGLTGEFASTGTSRELVLKAHGDGRASGTLELELIGAHNEHILVDRTKLTFLPADSFWSSWSTRGNTSYDSSFNYPTEGGRSGHIKLAPAAHPSQGQSEALSDMTLDHRPLRDPDRHVLVFIHGYNTDEVSANYYTGELYKRLYWTGFRGQLIGMGWDGDGWKVIPTLSLNPDDWRAAFDPNVLNALRAAPRVMQFLKDKVSTWTAGHPEHVDLMAHSLGNLVMWESLRLNEALGGGAIAHNVVSVEAAIPSEAFEPRQSLTYPTDPNYQVGSEIDNTTYSVDELMHDSWRFWFRQEGHDITRSLASGGRIINSYNLDDFALTTWMRFNDWILHGQTGIPLVGNHYVRGLGHGDFRTIDDSFGSNSLDRMPFLMSTRTAFYDFHQLNLPLGTVQSSLPGVINVNAGDFGWFFDSHGHFVYGDRRDDNQQDGKQDASLPTIWQWYQQVFVTQQGTAIG